MKTISQIDQEIESLKKALTDVKGTETEVYTRIVGYHRAVDNWNEGKKHEYKDRLTYKFNADEINRKLLISEYADQSNDTSESDIIDLELIDPDLIVSYKLFTSHFCRNCPPVKEYMKRLELNGEEIDVSTDFGITISNQYHVLATPTVIFFDCNNQILFKAFSISDLKKVFSRKKVLV